MKRKVITVFFREALTTPPLGGERGLNAEKFVGIELYTGVEPGFLTINYLGKEVGVPLANVKDLLWEKAEK